MIDINVHSNNFTAESVIFDKYSDPFVTFTIYADGDGGATFFLHNLENAERIAQAALEMLKNVQALPKDTTNV